MPAQNLPLRTDIGKRPCAYVESWYDRNSRNWTTVTKDAGNNQFGDASYSGNQAGRDVDHAAHVKDARSLLIAEKLLEEWLVVEPSENPAEGPDIIDCHKLAKFIANLL